MQHDNTQDITVVYDGQCPVCRGYCERLDAAPKQSALNLVDARQPSALMDDITARKWDIDQGMVVKTDAGLFYGSRAMHELAKAAKAKGSIGLATNMFFGSRAMAAVSYPLAKAFRNVVLRIKGIGKINNLGHVEAPVSRGAVVARAAVSALFGVLCGAACVPLSMADKWSAGQMIASALGLFPLALLITAVPVLLTLACAALFARPINRHPGLWAVGASVIVLASMPLTVGMVFGSDARWLFGFDEEGLMFVGGVVCAATLFYILSRCAARKN